MTEAAFHHALLIGWLALGAVTFVALNFVLAPYGRHAREGWGPKLPATAGWVLMESPAIAVIVFCFLVGKNRGAIEIALFALWMLHYGQRTLVFPFRLRGAKPMPLVIALFGFGFNLVNGYLIGRWLFTLRPQSTAGILASPAFLFGATVFIAGFAINLRSDAILRRLRLPGETGYKIPRGGLYRWVSCPNYLGEMIEWCGFAIATGALPGLAFFLWTAANLLPRARAHHKWYQRTFPDYPKGRRAVVPYLL